MDKDKLLKYFKSSTIITEGTFAPICELISKMTNKRYTITITHQSIASSSFEAVYEAADKIVKEEIAEKRGERINKILNIE